MPSEQSRRRGSEWVHTVAKLGKTDEIGEVARQALLEVGTILKA